MVLGSILVLQRSMNEITFNYKLSVPPFTQIIAMKVDDKNGVDIQKIYK